MKRRAQMRRFQIEHRRQERRRGKRRSRHWRCRVVRRRLRLGRDLRELKSFSHGGRWEGLEPNAEPWRGRVSFFSSTCYCHCCGLEHTVDNANFYIVVIERKMVMMYCMLALSKARITQLLKMVSVFYPKSKKFSLTVYQICLTVW